VTQENEGPEIHREEFQQSNKGKKTCPNVQSSMKNEGANFIAGKAEGEKKVWGKMPKKWYRSGKKLTNHIIF